MFHFNRVCLPKTTYNGPCIIFTLIIRSFLLQLYEIENSEILKELYLQELKLICQTKLKL